MAADRLADRHSDDLLGGAIERGDSMRAIGRRDQAGAGGLEDQVLEGLQVAQILLPGLELLAGGAVSLAEAAGDDRDDEGVAALRNIVTSSSAVVSWGAS